MRREAASKQKLFLFCTFGEQQLFSKNEIYLKLVPKLIKFILKKFEFVDENCKTMYHSRLLYSPPLSKSNHLNLSENFSMEFERSFTVFVYFIPLELKPPKPVWKKFFWVRGGDQSRRER